MDLMIPPRARTDHALARLAGHAQADVAQLEPPAWSALEAVREATARVELLAPPRRPLERCPTCDSPHWLVLPRPPALCPDPYHRW